MRPLVTVAVRCIPVARGPVWPSSWRSPSPEVLSRAFGGRASGIRGWIGRAWQGRSSRLWMMLLLAALAVVMLLLKDIVVGVA
jgi:hypothetical protein